MNVVVNYMGRGTEHYQEKKTAWNLAFERVRTIVFNI